MLRNVKVNNARSLGKWQLLTKVLVSCEKGDNGRSSFSSQDSGKTEATENVETKTNQLKIEPGGYRCPKNRRRYEEARENGSRQAIARILAKPERKVNRDCQAAGCAI